MAIQMVADSSLQQAMDTLTAQWYNAVITGCGLDASQFQLVQGSTFLGTTTEKVWNIFDSVPPLSISQKYNPSQFNSFSSNYGAVIPNLLAPGGLQFQNDMGDFYTQWTSYLKKTPPTFTGPLATWPQQLLSYFASWAMINLSPDQAQRCITDMQEVSNNPVSVANAMWAAMENAATNPGVRAYTGTIADVKTDITQGTGKSVQMDSSTASSDTSSSWAGGSVEGWDDFFGGEASASYSQWSQQLATAGVTVNTQYQKLATVSMGPLNEPDGTDPVLSNFVPWYNSAALNVGFQTKDNTVWKPGAHPDWNDTFGTNGNMLYVATALIVVDGIQSTITSTATFSAADHEEFRQAASGGFWPFVDASEGSGWTHDAQFNDQGQVTVTSTCPAGNPTILGVLVTPISKAL